MLSKLSHVTHIFVATKHASNKFFIGDFSRVVRVHNLEVLLGALFDEGRLFSRHFAYFDFCSLDPNLSEFFLIQSLVSSSMFLELFLQVAQ